MSSTLTFGIPDARMDKAHDPKRIYWLQLTIEDQIGQHEKGAVWATETIAHWKEAAECLYRGEKAVSHVFFTERKDPPVESLVTASGEIALANGDVVTLKVTERSTAQEVLAAAQIALAAKEALYTRLREKLGAAFTADLILTKPSAVVATNIPTAVQAEPIYVGQRKSPRDYPYVDGQAYLFETTAVTCVGEVGESGEVVYKWKLWSKYRNGFGQYPDFEIDSARADAAEVVQTLHALDLAKAIRTHLPVRMHYTARARFTDSKKKPGQKTLYFNPVQIETLAAPAQNAQAAW